MAAGTRPTASKPGDPGRYAYLVARLRNRQITMEEATELFGVMDITIRSLRAANVPSSSPPVPTPPAERPRSPPATVSTSMSTDDLLAAGILLIGAGAGVASALRERARAGPPPRASPSEPATKPTSSS